METASEIAQLPQKIQLKFIWQLSQNILENNGDPLIYAEAFLINTDRWRKIKAWMDGRFQKDMALTPLRVAHLCIYYHKINSKMLPFLIVTAQKIKNRVRHRIKYRIDRGGMRR